MVGWTHGNHGQISEVWGGGGAGAASILGICGAWRIRSGREEGQESGPCWDGERGGSGGWGYGGIIYKASAGFPSRSLDREPVMPE